MTVDCPSGLYQASALWVEPHLSAAIDERITGGDRRFQFVSLVHCNIEPHTTDGWLRTGGGTLHQFVTSASVARLPTAPSATETTRQVGIEDSFLIALDFILHYRFGLNINVMNLKDVICRSMRIVVTS